MGEMTHTLGLVQEWNCNELHWANNRRRLAGLPPLRGKSNDRCRRFPNRYMLFRSIDSDLNLACEKAIEDQINSFADIKDIQIGSRICEITK